MQPAMYAGTTFHITCFNLIVAFDMHPLCQLNCLKAYIISIFHGCIVWIDKSVTRVTDRHHEACRVMPNSDPE